MVQLMMTRRSIKLSVIASASALVRMLNLKTVCAFGGRHGPNLAVLPILPQWTKTFGIDIDTRGYYTVDKKGLKASAKRRLRRTGGP